MSSSDLTRSPDLTAAYLAGTVSAPDSQEEVIYDAELVEPDQFTRYALREVRRAQASKRTVHFFGEHGAVVTEEHIQAEVRIFSAE